MAKAKRKVAKLVTKKVWVPILAPKMFNEEVIGETLIAEPPTAIGRLVPVNLMNLIGDIKRQNVNIVFKINNATGNKLYTEVIGYEMLASSIKRIVRRGKNKIDSSLTAQTADNCKLVIKLVMITLNMTNLSMLTAVRKACADGLKKMVSKMSYEDFVRELVGYQVQMTLKKQIKKVYPLKSCEVRYMRLVERGAAPVVKKVEAEKAKAMPVEEAPKEAKPAEAPKSEESKVVENA